MRTISAAGVSEYKLNGRAVSWDDYNKRMIELGVLVKARNFLVFQVRYSLRLRKIVLIIVFIFVGRAMLRVLRRARPRN